MWLCMYEIVFINVCMNVCMYLCVNEFRYVCVHVCIYIFLCMHMFMWVHVYMCIYEGCDVNSSVLSTQLLFCFLAA